jgi:hypothetical protein
MRRTTIRLDDPLLAEAKKFAADTGRTLTAVMEDALREVLARRKQPNRRSKLRLTTFAGKGLQPGVDLDDSAALLDRMEGPHAAH